MPSKKPEEKIWMQRPFSFLPLKVEVIPDNDSFITSFKSEYFSLGKEYRMILSIYSDGKHYIPSAQLLSELSLKLFFSGKWNTGFYLDEEDYTVSIIRQKDRVNFAVDFTFSLPKLLKGGETMADTIVASQNAAFLKSDPQISFAFSPKNSFSGGERFMFSIDSFAEKIKGSDILQDGAEEVLKKSEQKEVDMVNHPPHYNATPIDTWEMFSLMFHDRPEYLKGALLFNTLKYKDRAGRKDGTEQDIQKMLWHLKRFETMFPDDAILYNLYHDLRIKK